jgi:tetratricopeptide (TPR) repeat protein
MLTMLAVPVAAQTAPSSTTIASLGLAPEKVSHLNAAVGAHDYVAAEALLLKEIEQDPHSARAGQLLAYVGSIYFLNQDYLNAAIAWKKSEAIAPLRPDLQFSLAMAYIRIGHPEWARPVLHSLATANNKNALYPYWSGRLEYDAHQYDAAMQLFEQAIALDPAMARAYDSLGLCRFYRNENELALQAFARAIELEQNDPRPSAWPYVNRAATLQFLGRTQEAEHDLRQAVRLEPDLAQAHFQLGNVLEHENQRDLAVAEFKEAIRLNAKYAEPHLALAQIYRQTGHPAEAEGEVKNYQQLHEGAGQEAR